MNIIIESTLKTLYKSQFLLNKMTDEELCNATVSPYYSSIGTHVRHILDFYDCIFSGYSQNQVDLTVRSRNKSVESKCDFAKDYLNSIIDKLNTLDFEVDKTVSVKDDLGLGTVEIPYTYGALFVQANSHTIHHYAIINYILDRLGITIDDTNFGYNATTPKAASLDN